MHGKIAFVYIAATCGGVERVFLNRGEALLRHYPNLEIEVYFYQDWGGAAPFAHYVRDRKLSQRFRVVESFEPSRYDAIYAVDTPRVLAEHPEAAGKIVMECHTAYAANRAYLQEWQTRLHRLVVPSLEFQRVIEAECTSLRGKVQLVRNFVPALSEAASGLSLPGWNGPLFLYFGRIDSKKNIGEMLEGMRQLKNTRNLDSLGVICGQVDPGYPLRDVIGKSGLRGRVALLPPVPFARSSMMLQLFRRRGAVLVSCSQGESFGLSVAEAMSAGLPVILSDIQGHSALVGGRREFLYPLGDPRQLASKMAAALEHYDRLSAECIELAKEFSEEAFLEDWQRLTPTVTLV